MYTNYDIAIIFTKHTNLLQWFDAKYPAPNNTTYDELQHYCNLRKRYAIERDVELMLLVRFEGDKLYCKIKCPINPLPIRGEFEAISLRTIVAFLGDNGWTMKQRIEIAILK